ncbi:cathepsin G-like [Aegotheles albertisi]
MARLSIKNESGISGCGGFLIRADAVLSAAHCVTGKGRVNITVTLGAHNIRKEESSQQKFHIGRWVVHPKYSRKPLRYDIVLLKLTPKAKLSKKVTYIRLPSHKERAKPGTTCNVAGWGRTSTTGKKTNVLMEVDLKVQQDKECQKTFKNYLPESMICVGDKDGKKSAFCGDSGGPLVCNGKAHGIFSYMPEYRIFPEVFTKVSSFEPWIRKELRKFELQELPESPSSD